MDKEQENVEKEIEESFNQEVGEFTDTVEEADTSESENAEKVDEPKTYTKEEMDAEIEKIASGREARAFRKAERESQKQNEKLSKIIDTLKVGLGKEDLDDIDSELKEFYNTQGIKIPEIKSRINERDEKILAKADAEEIISLGEDEINKVANEIYSKPVQSRTIRENIIFQTLGNHIVTENAKKELAKTGANVDILNDNKFKEFAKKFSSNTDISEIYNLFEKVNPIQKKEKPKSTGSAKDTADTKEVKDFYTFEESNSFTRKDYDRNPKLYEAVKKSMLKW